jgi:peptidoglycan/LPS O-acetylase OafA/YrhL
MPISHTRSTLNSIQVLRAVAALAVLLHHADPHYAAMGGTLSFIHAASQWGFSGVDIFFVISGFIMGYTTFNKPRTSQSAKVFLKHRFYRIYLGYWPFFFAMFFMLYLKDPQHLFQLNISGSFFLTETNMFKLVLPVSWSLSYELYFYLLFTLTFFFPAKVLRFLVPFFMVFLAGWAWYSHTHLNDREIFFVSHFLLEFFAGVMLYLFHHTLTQKPFLWILPALIVLSYWTGIHLDAKNGILRVLTFGSGALSVVWFFLILEKQYHLRFPKLFVALGNASYTFYLSHLLILGFFYAVGLRDMFTSHHTQILPLTGLLSIIVLCSLFSLLYYHYIEKPLYRFATKHF